MPKLMNHRFGHQGQAGIYNVDVDWRSASTRPTVGSIVKIRSTANTRQYASSMIGLVYKIATDVGGHQPFQVDNHPVWFYETDVDTNLNDHAAPSQVKPGLSRPSQPLGDGGWPDKCGWSPANASTSPAHWSNMPGNKRAWPKWDAPVDNTWSFCRESTTDSQMLTREPTAESYAFSREPTSDTLPFSREPTAEFAPWTPSSTSKVHRLRSTADCFVPSEQQNLEIARSVRHGSDSVVTDGFSMNESLDSRDAKVAQDVGHANVSDNATEHTDMKDDAADGSTAWQNADSDDEAEHPTVTLYGEQLEVRFRGTFLDISPRSRGSSRRARSAPGFGRHDQEEDLDVQSLGQMYCEKFCGDVEKLWDTVAAVGSTESVKHGACRRAPLRSMTSESLKSYPEEIGELERTASASTSPCVFENSLAEDLDPADVEALAASMPPLHQELLKEFQLGSADLPTVGSAGHYFSHCKPCCFVFTKGCSNGVSCVFCHLCEIGEKKRRQKDRYEKRKKQWRQMIEKRGVQGQYNKQYTW